MADDANTPHGYADSVVERVADTLLPRAQKRRKPLLVGLSGLQGSGKSTFAAQLRDVLNARSIATVSMSLDDFYFTRRERATLAREIHLLFATRGVPGTHDLHLLNATLDALAKAAPRHPVLIPRFDKGRDTRMARARWTRVTAPPRLILFEGWCLSVPAQTRAQLRRPLNALERDEDAGGTWRGHVNTQLEQDYAKLWRRFDCMILLQAPSFDIVQRWRDEAEQSRRAAHAPHAMTPAQLRRFLMHYERLSRQALRTLPARADVRIVLDAQRGVRRIASRSTHARAKKSPISRARN